MEYAGDSHTGSDCTGTCGPHGSGAQPSTPSHASLPFGEAAYRSVVESAFDAVVTTDRAGLIAGWNGGAERTFGYTAGEVLGRHVTRLMPDRYAAVYAAAVAAPRVPGRVVELVGVRKGGEEFPLDLAVTRWESEHGRHVTAVMRDTTERRRLQEELRQAQKMEAIGRLAGGVAHDFNNLLTVINGYADLLAQGLPAESPARSWVAEIAHAGERAADLTRELLTFGRKQVVCPAVLDLNATLTAMHKMMCRLIGEDVELVLRLQDGVGTVRVDRGQLQQVVMNLVVNARDAMPGGGRVTIETARELPPGRGDPAVCLSVTDTGVGMSGAVRERIFEPFFTTKDLGKGTGLGLATVHGIVSQYGGHIKVESELGRGTAVSVLLPHHGGAAVPPSACLGVERGAGTVLVVEDEETVRRMIVVALTFAGYAVLEAADTDRALEVMDRDPGRVNLLLTDVVLPGRNGRELVETVARRHPAVRLLVMSGYAGDEMLRRGIRENGVPFIQKPFTPVMLLRAVQSVLPLKAGPTPS